MAIMEPAYVQAWDALEFPTLDPRTSSVEIPLFHQRVSLVREDDESGEECWKVVKGHPLVAKRMAEWAGGDDDTHDVQGWINDARAAAKRDERDWKRRWADKLNANPAIAAALERGAAGLFERAGLTAFEVRAIELHVDGKNLSEMGRALGITRQSATERLERAFERILSLDQHESDLDPAPAVLGI